MNRLPEQAGVLLEKARGNLYALERLLWGDRVTRAAATMAV